MNPNTSPSDPRRPDLLAGYADSELSPADRATVEAWVAVDPTAQAELDLQQRLSLNNRDLWNRVTPPEPSEAAWNGVMAGIHDRLKPTALVPSYRTNNNGRRSSHRFSAAAVIAMGLLIAVGVWYPSFQNGHNNASMVDDDVMQIVRADEVTITDMQGDEAMLVIGRAPLAGPLDLVTIGDTELWAISTDPSETPTKPNTPVGDPNRHRWIDKATPVP
jgi:hypothetical protein